jgi:soluble lytic murein transglycosylase-like protein
VVRRRRSHRRLLKRARIWLLRHTLLAFALTATLILALNLAVRSAGGAVSLASTSWLGTRSRAVSLLAVHALRCRLGDADAAAAVREAAVRHGISERLALAVARVESSLVHTRISATGAMGLMQLMPNTARELGVRDPFDVRDSADGGVRYLKRLLVSYRGDVKRALAAYNAGSGRVPLRGPLTLPLETRTYVSRVVSGL